VKAAALNQETVSLALLSGVLTFLPVLTPVEGLVLTTLTPTPLIVLAVKYSWQYVLGLIGIEAGVMWLVGDLPAGFFFSQYVSIALVIAWAVRRRASLAQTILGSILVPLALGGILLAVYGILTQQSLSLLLTSYLNQLLSIVREQIQGLELGPGDAQDPVAGGTEALPRLVLSIFPAMVVINHLFTNVLNYVLARYFCARSRPPHAFDALRLTHWRAWEYLVWVFLTSGAALLLPWALLNAIGLNVFLVTLAIYLLQGLAIVAFWGQRVPFPPAVRVVLVLMIFVMTGPLGLVLCIAAGLFDLWADFRRLRQSPLSP
jgi:hypothetical protein